MKNDSYHGIVVSICTDGGGGCYLSRKPTSGQLLEFRGPYGKPRGRATVRDVHHYASVLDCWYVTFEADIPASVAASDSVHVVCEPIEGREKAQAAELPRTVPPYADLVIEAFELGFDLGLKVGKKAK